MESLFSKKWLTSHIEREHQPKIGNVSKKNFPEKQKQDNNPSFSPYENHVYVVTGPRNVGKTYYMLQILQKIGNKKPFHMITRSLNQHPIHKTSLENKPIEKDKESIVFF